MNQVAYVILCLEDRVCAAALPSNENYLNKSYGSVFTKWNVYVPKLFGQLENDINTSHEKHISVDEYCNTGCSISIAK